MDLFKVQLVAGEVTGFSGSQVALADGQLLDADVVVLATGYRPLNDSVERCSTTSSTTYLHLKHIN